MRGPILLLVPSVNVLTAAAEVYAPMTLSAICIKAKEIAKERVPLDFAFSTSWFYGFCKFFRISCRLAAEASGSDRLQIEELNVPRL